jgi:C4-dicarboxylate-binding protein DctP
MHSTIGRLTAIGALAAAVLAVTPATAQQFTMKMSFPTINDVHHEFFKRLKDGIDKRSGGRIKTEIYPANQLGQIPAVVEGVALGTIEVGVAATGFFASLEPRFQVLDAPGLFDDIAHANRVLTDPAIQARIATWGADRGIEVLSAGVYSPYTILSVKPIRSVADFQGQKMRTTGGTRIQIEPFRKLGILPVSLPLGEALPAMRNRTIDAVMSGPAVFTNFKYYDVAKAMTYLPSTMLLAPSIVNRRWLQSLGPELEAIVREEARKAEIAYDAWNVQDNQRVEGLWRQNGGELIMLPEAEAKRYLDIVTPISAEVLSANPKVKEDYEALLETAKKYRR